MNNLDAVYNALVDLLDDGKDLDVPFLIQKNRGVLTKRDIINDLNSRSSYGLLYLSEVLKLATDMIKEAKRKTQNFESAQVEN